MRPDIKTVKEITQGAENVVFENGRFKFLRFTENETKTTGNPNLFYTAGVCLEFKTDGSALLLKVNMRQETGIRWYFSVDIYEDGKEIGHIKNFDDALCIGDYVGKEYGLGSFSGEFGLKGGEKCIRIILPYSVAAEIEEFEVKDAAYIEPVRKEKKLIAYGDSITQGYDALFPSDTYAMRLADELGAELFNKGLGGAPFLPELAEASEKRAADFVTVAYGTNDWGGFTKEEFFKNADAFVKAVTEKYPETPVFVITPIWRKDLDEDKIMGSFSVLEEVLAEVCGKYGGVTVIPGLSLVPHDEKYFGDLRLHPNRAGFEQYFKNLADQIRSWRI